MQRSCVPPSQAVVVRDFSTSELEPEYACELACRIVGERLNFGDGKPFQQSDRVMEGGAEPQEMRKRPHKIAANTRILCGQGCRIGVTDVFVDEPRREFGSSE